MKLLLTTVYAIAVFAVDGRDFGNETAKSQLFPDTSNIQSWAQHSLKGLKQDYQLEDIPRERRRRKTLCRRRLGGRCVRRRKRCPGYLPSQTSPGKPYCSKFHRCCHQAVCPDGFFKSGNQCFKFFPDFENTWEVTKSMCEAEGLVLAKPDDPVALRKLMVEIYGDHYVWLGAQGTDTGDVVWDRDGTTLSMNNSAWRPGFPGFYATTDNCLLLVANQMSLDQHPTHPYVLDYCGQWLNFYAMCELVI